MPIDAFKGHARGLTSPAGDAFAVVPSDTQEFVRTARAIYVGGGGDIALRTVDGTDVTFRNVVAGTVLPVGAVRVAVTGTTAQNLVALV